MRPTDLRFRPGSSSASRGFTLIELLVVIAIIAILVALLLPAVQQVREAARKSQCQDHLHNLVIAVMSYESSHQLLPMGCAQNSFIGTGTAAFGWGSFILPFCEQKPLFDQLRVNELQLSQVMGDANLRELTRTPLALFRCPSDNAEDTMEGMRAKNGAAFNLHWNNGGPPNGFYTATSNYVANVGHKRLGHANNSGPIFRMSSVSISDIQDGTSNVFFIGERDMECGCGTWVGSRNGGGHGGRGNNYIFGNVYQKPNGTYLGNNNLGGINGSQDFATCLYGFSSRHPGGTQFGMGDGKVVFVSENIDFANNYCNGNGMTCNQDQEGRYADAANGPPIGVYQRLGIIDDGLPVGSP